MGTLQNIYLILSLQNAIVEQVEPIKKDESIEITSKVDEDDDVVFLKMEQGGDDKQSEQHGPVYNTRRSSKMVSV